MRFFRLLKIIFVVLSFGLDEFMLAHQRMRWLQTPLNLLLFMRDISQPRAVRLRLALEKLGPIFVKFGQMLSTRRDLMPTDLADELAKLQDQVPPFSSVLAVSLLEAAYQRPLLDVFKSFEQTPVASASVAQVHFGVLHDDREVAIKILRPGIALTIAHDIALIKVAADLIEWLWADGRRLKPRRVIEEFEKHLSDELDLTREAANGSQLRRNFADSGLLLVPEMFWDYCTNDVMVMERMYGMPISQVDNLRAAGVDIPKLAANGVEIFYTQVFRDGFFHADMHPGNVQVAKDGRYIALDFGIVGNWAERNKVNYTTYTDLSSKTEIVDLIQKEVEKVNKALPENAKVKRFVLLYKELDPDDDELTRTRKVRRHFVEEKYKEIIEGMYEGMDSVKIEAIIKFQDGKTSTIKTVMAVRNV